MLTVAQTTNKKVTKSSTTKTEMRGKSSVQQSNSLKMLDTANIEQRQKEADGKIISPDGPHGDGLTDEATKPSQVHPRPGQTE